MTRCAVILIALAGCSDPAVRATAPPREPDLPRASRPDRTPERVGDVCVLRARNSKDIVARFKSTVAELFVKLDDSVAKDQPLARLDDRQLRDDLVLAKAQLQQRRAAVNTASAQRRAAAARYKLERDAFAAGIVAKAVMDEAQSALETAVTAVNAAATAVSEQQARIKIAEKHLEDTTLVAPEAGRVALIYHQPGEPVSDGTPVVRVISNDELMVVLASEAKHRPTQDQAIELTLDDRKVVKAIVRRVTPNVHPVAGLIVSEADLVDAPPGLQSGMSCRYVPKAGAPAPATTDPAPPAKP